MHEQQLLNSRKSFYFSKRLSMLATRGPKVLYKGPLHQGIQHTQVVIGLFLEKISSEECEKNAKSGSSSEYQGFCQTVL